MAITLLSQLYESFRTTALSRPVPPALRKAKPILPPVAVEAFSNLRSEWEYAGSSWPTATGDGWNHASIAKAQELHWQVLLENTKGPGPLGVAHFPGHTNREDHEAHNVVMSYAYTLARAARNKERIVMLDWGGGVGHYYLYSKALLPELDLEYHCYDVPSLCQVGHRLLPQATFHDDADAALARRYDLVLASSSLHYSEHWQDVLQRLASATDGLLYVARLQTVKHGDSFVVCQRPRRIGYLTQYYSWFLNRDLFLECAERLGLLLVREFIYDEKWYLKSAPVQGESRGFLFDCRNGSRGQMQA